VLSGTVRKGDVVKIFGNNYKVDEEEDMDTQKITNLWIY